MVPVLIPSKNFQERSPTINPEEIASITDYYDGGNKLNTIAVTCKMYTKAKDCVHQSGCGWCGALSACVSGNQMGPLEQCPKSTYIFTSPVDWSQERLVTETVGGLAYSLTSK